MQCFVNTVLYSVHLLRRRTLARNKGAEDNAAVSGRQECLGNYHKEPDRSGKANYPDYRRDPSVAQEPPQRIAIKGQYTLFDTPYHSLHPGFLRALTTILQ